ncbi:MAG: hypothetical protein KJT03_06520 [Verrucomicrobiae bacterium]|nr:hypothetical protein [Verrucomicrobiae bacterium]
MKILNWILCFLFLLSAGLQYNDPDPIQWMLMWAGAGVACLLFGIKKLPKWVPMAEAVIAICWAGYILPKIISHMVDIHWNEVFMQAKMSNLTVEYVREFGGLLIILIWMIVLILQTRKKPA